MSKVMAHERAFEIQPEERVRYRVQFTTARGRVTNFVVQLEVQIGSEWEPVVRYDTAHGRPHRDLYRVDGTATKQWLEMNFNDALTYAINEIKDNWRRCAERWLKI
jgi:hypothetical protein